MRHRRSFKHRSTRAGIPAHRRSKVRSNRKFGRRARPHRANVPHRAMRGGIRF